MASLAVETQLEKDVASNAGVIPIWPWINKDGKPKDNLPPRIYANRLRLAKEDNGQPGRIIQCDSDGCEHSDKSMYWRSNETSVSVVPKGWTNYGGMAQFKECPLCRARNLEDGFGSEELEYGREDINLKHGSTGTTDGDKPLRPLTVSLPRLERPNKRRKLNEKAGLKRHASEIFKNHPEHLKAVLKQIDDDERKKRANAAESRKRKRTGGRRKKMRKTRRKKRRKTRRKKRHRKKRTRRRRK